MIYLILAICSSAVLAIVLKIFQNSKGNRCGIISGALYVAGLVTMQTSTRMNGATLTAVFSKMGLIISLAVSIFVFGERPGQLQIVGVVLVLAAMVLLNL